MILFLRIRKIHLINFYGFSFYTMSTKLFLALIMGVILFGG